VVPPATLAPRPRPGDELELSVDSLAFGGAGVARREGYVVFVAGAIPGDTVRAVVGRAKRAYAEARVVEVLRPSPDRTEPQADHPGAPWQILPYAMQLETKQSQLEDALRRIGRLDGFELEPIVPALETWRYRNKLEYSFGSGPGGELVCGFHAPGRFEQIVAVDDCMLASHAGNRAREAVLEWCRGQGLAPFDRRSGEGLLRNLVVREGRRTGELQVRLVTSPATIDTDSLAAALSGIDGVLWSRIDSPAEISTGGRTTLVSGRARLREQIGGLALEVSPEAFLQTNTEMAERLYALAIEYAELSGFERIYDLYCGIGTLGLLMAPRAAQLFGLEIVPEAVADAIETARRNDIAGASFYAGDVRLSLRELVQTAGRPDIVVLDPPRAGLSQKVVRRVLEAAPKRIVYVSCNPTTLAPNAAQLVEGGYRLNRVRAVDMFPQTPHVECVAVLDRA
jgi:23S rRNA (uracil1939-C5)-methyltransferase